MIIVPTRICNTDKCGYCGVLKEDFEMKYFKEFHIGDFIEKIHILSKKTGDYELRFFGGEPFLEFSIIKKIITQISVYQDYTFTINTNLSLLSLQHLEFIKQYNIKIIMSCNGDLYSHCLTRGVNKEQAFSLYDNIKIIIQNNINYQINIVSTPEVVERLSKNFNFISDKLGGKIFNFLPVNYNGWSDKKLEILESELNKIRKSILNNTLTIKFINKEVNNSVSLFNSELVIDSDGKIYPNMVILEYFFKEEKSKILLTSCTKGILEFTKDINNFDINNNILYELFINKTLKKKFGELLENDNKSSIIFHNFLQDI